MKLYTKTIQCEEIKINATVTRQMIDDIKNMESIDLDSINRQILLELRREKIEKIFNRINNGLDR